MRRGRTWAVIGSTLLGFVLLGGVGAPAVASGPTVVVQESFTNDQPGDPANWVVPPASAATSPQNNDACLTNSSDTSPTIRNCGDSAGLVGGLQLTPNTGQQEGGVQYASSVVPSDQGLSAAFETQQFGGSSHGDGISFYLAASDPNTTNATPVTLGPQGGNLGYSAGGSTAGLTNGYLGVGLDVFGNYSTSAFDESDCSGNSTNGQTTSNSVTVRGPGNGTAGYCRLGTQSNPLLYDGSHSVPVDVAINPTGNTLTAPGAPLENMPFRVPAGQFAVQYFPDNASTPSYVHGKLPDASGYVEDQWLGAGGIPKRLSFGWSASTGDSTDYHVVWNTTVSTLASPTLGVQLTDDSGGTAQSGQTVTYSATTTVSDADADQPITMTDTFPNTLTPQLANGGSGTNWTCSLSGGGQTVTCTHPAAAQGSLETLSMPVTVNVPSGPSQSVSDMVTVSSPDATKATYTKTETYAPAPTPTALKFIGQPVSTQVNQAMTDADSNPTHVQVEVDLAGGAPDTSFTGPGDQVTLGFSPGDQNNPQFLVGPSNTPVNTITVNADDGVADFSPITINAQGFGDTLTATSTGLTGATSKQFDVTTGAAGCESNNTCPPVNVNSSPATGETALVQGQAGPGNTIITATFGGNVAPIHPCTGATAGILTVSGDRQKIITFSFPAKVQTLVICYGQPTAFKDITLHNTTFFNNTNNDYEGALGSCQLVPVPCLKSLTWKKNVETVVIVSAVTDPHAMH